MTITATGTPSPNTGTVPGQVHHVVDQHVLVHGPDRRDLGGLVAA